MHHGILFDRRLSDMHVTHTQKGKLYTCLVDFKKVFDSIWHQGLLYKLLKYSIGGKICETISSMYIVLGMDLIDPNFSTI